MEHGKDPASARPLRASELQYAAIRSNVPSVSNVPNILNGRAALIMATCVVAVCRSVAISIWKFAAFGFVWIVQTDTLRSTDTPIEFVWLCSAT